MDDRDDWRGLGPRSRAWLREAGVDTAEALRGRDPVALYLAVRDAHPEASLNLLWALAGAQQRRPWRQVAREQRTDLLLRLDDALAARREHA